MAARTVLAFSLFVVGCDESSPPDCRCVGAVPEGVLDVACGDAQCVAGSGYLCTGPNTAEPFPAACSSISDAGVADAGSDAGPMLPLQESCDPLTRGSCPAGQRCGLSRQSGQPTCSYASADDRGPGEACQLVGDGDDCGDGLTCVSDGTCASLCSATDYSGCSRGESCNIPIDDVHNACSASCDLVTTGGCPQGTTCGVFGDASGAVYKDCNVAGAGVQGESCGSDSPCAPGHVCAYWSNPPFLSGFECLQLCDPNGVDGPACPEGTTCSYAPNEIEPFGTIDQVGACR